jgi:Flp pilus assembly protein TadB
MPPNSKKTMSKWVGKELAPKARRLPALPLVRFVEKLTRVKVRDELEQEVFMAGILVGVAALLVILWVLGKIVFGIAGALIHLLLVIAVIALIVGVIRAAAGRRV